MYGGKWLGANWVQGKHTAVSFKGNAKNKQQTKTCKIKREHNPLKRKPTKTFFMGTNDCPAWCCHFL
jgi:hypothetical protein